MDTLNNIVINILDTVDIYSMCEAHTL